MKLDVWSSRILTIFVEGTESTGMKPPRVVKRPLHFTTLLYRVADRAANAVNSSCRRTNAPVSNLPILRVGKGVVRLLLEAKRSDAALNEVTRSIMVVGMAS